MEIETLENKNELALNQKFEEINTILHLKDLKTSLWTVE
jgi:hypothetical protein